VFWLGELHHVIAKLFLSVKYLTFENIIEIMAGRSLNSFYAGFTSVERQLLKMEHTGWVHYSKSGGIELYKSQFRVTPANDSCKYIIPADLRPAEHELVTLEVEKPDRKITNRISNTSYYNFKDSYRVVGVLKPNPNEIAVMQRPYLNADDLQDRLSLYWKNADQDLLDFSLSLQILSCSEGTYGRGGIGTKSLAGIGTSRRPLLDLKRTIAHLLPSEFRNGKNKYLYDFIESPITQRKVEKFRLRSDISEVSYNHIWQLPPQSPVTCIQIPTLIYNANYTGALKEIDQDILEYLLTALMINPPIEDNLISRIEDAAQRVNQKANRDEDFARLNIDRFSSIKVANAICRLHLTPKLDEDTFDRDRDKFESLMRMFMDVEKDIERPEGQTYAVPLNQTSYLDKWMEPIDSNILRVMRKLKDDLGLEWITQQDIENHPEFNPKWSGDWRVQDSFSRLNNLSLIIKSPRGIGYKRVRLS
jgi:hypothetical protein